MVRVLFIVMITAMMPVTTKMMVIRSCLLLQNKKRKNKRKREPSPEPSSSDSENFFSSKNSIEEGAFTKNQLFQITSESESDKWELPGGMTDYVSQQFECFTPEKDAEENLVIIQSVPDNVRSVKKIWMIL